MTDLTICTGYVRTRDPKDGKPREELLAVFEDGRMASTGSVACSNQFHLWLFGWIDQDAIDLTDPEWVYIGTYTAPVVI